MILDYVKFKNFPLTAEIPLFLVHGNPRNISNEIERDIINFFRKLDFKTVNYVIDDDTQTEDIKSNLYEQSLFEEKKLFVINIVSKSIPMNMKKLIFLTNFLCLINFLQGINNKNFIINIYGFHRFF